MLPLYFIAFLATLAVALLLYAGALVTAALRRGALPPLLTGAASDGIQLLSLALAWLNFGVTWLLYFNVYRIHVDMAALGNAAFQAFARGYTTRLAIVVLPYGVGALAAMLALWSTPGRCFSRRAMWGIATLWVLSMLSTPWAAGAQDDFADFGFTPAAFAQLQAAHLVRSLCVSAAALWALWEAWKASVMLSARRLQAPAP